MRQPGREGLPDRLICAPARGRAERAQEPLGGAFVIGREGDTERGSWPVARSSRDEPDGHVTVHRGIRSRGETKWAKRKVDGD